MAKTVTVEAREKTSVEITCYTWGQVNKYKKMAQNLGFEFVRVRDTFDMEGNDCYELDLIKQNEIDPKTLGF